MTITVSGNALNTLFTPNVKQATPCLPDRVHLYLKQALGHSILSQIYSSRTWALNCVTSKFVFLLLLCITTVTLYPNTRFQYNPQMQCCLWADTKLLWSYSSSAHRSWGKLEIENQQVLIRANTLSDMSTAAQTSSKCCA